MGRYAPDLMHQSRQQPCMGAGRGQSDLPGLPTPGLREKRRFPRISSSYLVSCTTCSGPRLDVAGVSTETTTCHLQIIGAWVRFHPAIAPIPMPCNPNRGFSTFEEKCLKIPASTHVGAAARSNYDFLAVIPGHSPKRNVERTEDGFWDPYSGTF